MGFKPSELSGPTGKGWNLNASGVITRVIHGLKDESTEGFYYRASDIKTTVETYINNNGQTVDFGQVLQGIVDGEPDIFYFNFGTYSGSFFWGADGEFHLNSQQKLKIDFEISSSVPVRDYGLHNAVQQNFISFTLTSEDGTRYTFDNCEYSRSTIWGIPNWSSHLDRAISAWYLSTITGANGQKITFDYSLAPANPNRIQESYLDNHYLLAAPGGLQGSSTSDRVLNFSHEIYLDSIKGNGWKIALNYQDFIRSTSLMGYNDSAKRIIDISLYDLTSRAAKLVKGYKMEYENKTDFYYLDKLIEKGNDLEELPAHIFHYYGNNYQPSLTRGLDYFGFYNGQNNTSLISENANRTPNLDYARFGSLYLIEYPTGAYSNYSYELNDYTGPLHIDSTKFYKIDGISVINPILYVNQAVNIDIAITFTAPSGIYNCDVQEEILGYTLVPKAGNAPYDIYDFIEILEDYVLCDDPLPTPLWYENLELNITARYPLTPDNLPGPGVRIKTITNSDPYSSNPNVTTSYEYLIDSTSFSSGEVFGFPVQTALDYGINGVSQFKSSNSFHGMSSIPVNYLQVVEKVNAIKRNKYYFTSQKIDAYNNEMGLGFPSSSTNIIGSYADYSAMRGKVKRKESYGNDSLLLQAEETNYYPKNYYKGNPVFYSTPAMYTLKMGIVFDPFFGITFPIIYSKAYFPSSYWFYPVQTKQIVYDENGENPVASTTDLSYENVEHYQLTKSLHTNSDGTQRTEQFKYPLDYKNVVAKDPIIDSLINNHRANALLEHTVSVGGQVLDATAFSYAQHTGNSKKTRLFLPDKEYRFQATGTFVPYTGQIGGINSSNYFENLAYVAYDTLGQVLQTHDFTGLDVSLIRAYRSRYPIAVVANANKLTVDAALVNAGTSQNALSNEINNTVIENAISGLQTYLPQSQVTGLLYSPFFGMIKSITPDKLNTSFSYDSFGRLAGTKDHFGKWTQLYEYQLRGTSTTLHNQIIKRNLRIATNDSTEAIDHLKANSTYDYFDGFGKPWQSLAWRQSPLEKNLMLSAVVFDNVGRIEKTYLPTSDGQNTAAPISNIHTAAVSFYSDYYPFTKSEYYGSSETIKYSTDPGAVLHSNHKSKHFGHGTAGVGIRKYSINPSNTISIDGTYPTFSLSSNTFTNEQDHITVEYKDKRGRLVESWQQIDTTTWAVTHYLYDELDRPKAIIQPEGYALNSGFTYNSTDFSNYVFFYEYDAHNRISRKHIPAAGWTDIVYDRADRPVMEQNAYQKTLNRWNFTQYDVFNRVVAMGITNNTTNRAAAQSLFDTHTIINELPGSISYSGNSFPTTLKPQIDQVQQFNFYDDYGFIASEFSFKPIGAFHTQKTNTKGLLTGVSKRNSKDGTRYYTDIYYYDNLNRIIQSQQTHQRSTSNQNNVIVKNLAYNFANEVIKEYATYPFTIDTLLVKIHNHYDHVGRLTQTDFGINAEPVKIIEYSYDEIGRLLQKKYMPDSTYSLGNPDYIYRPPSPGANTEDKARKAVILESGTLIDADSLITYLAEIDSSSSGTPFSGLQTMNYAWHIRGGLKGINIDGNGNPTPDHTQGDLFSYKLDYENAAQWSGNIGKQSWNHVDNANAVGIREYLYTYDNADRLKIALFSSQSEPVEDYGIPNINYDKNGNILNLQRKGKTSASTFGDIDNLTYSYSGNRLNTVNDAVTGNENTGDFRDVSGSTDYTYYENGALKSDANKGVSLIEHNTFLDKISKINYTNGDWIEFNYDGSGALIKPENSNGDYWEYADKVIYKNGELYSLQIPEGRAIFEGGVWKLAFEYRDVWNNLRVSFGADGDRLVKKQQSDYDVYGYEFNKKTVASTNYFKYQNQERIEDLGPDGFPLNIDFFKYRPSDPTIGRFWSGVDPLAEKYAYNSVYALQENKFGLGVELEGAEMVGFAEMQMMYYKAKDWFTNTGVGRSLQGTQQYVRNEDKHRSDAGYKANVPSGVRDLRHKTGKATAINEMVKGGVETMEAITNATGLALGGIEGTLGGASGHMLKTGLSDAISRSEITVYRVFGGDSRAQGFSWTPLNPSKINDFRNLAGLPSGKESGVINTADFLIKGKVNPAKILEVRGAKPLDGNKGGLKEFLINPKDVKLTDFSIIKP